MLAGVGFMDAEQDDEHQRGGPDDRVEQMVLLNAVLHGDLRT